MREKEKKKHPERMVCLTHTWKPSCSPSVKVPVVVSNCLIVFEEYSLPHPCLQAELRPPSSSIHSVVSYFPPPLTHHFLFWLNLPSFLCFFPSFHPLRAAGSARSLLQGSELITSVLDRRATRGHTLPEDRSIHARGNRGTGAGGY